MRLLVVMMAVLIAVLIAGGVESSRALEFRLSAEQVSVGDFTVDELTIDGNAADEFTADELTADQSTDEDRGAVLGLGIRARIRGVRHPSLGSIGDFELRCRSASAERCTEIEGRWHHNDNPLADLTVSRAGRDAQGRLVFSELNGLPSTMLDVAGLGVLEGSVALDATWAAGQLTATLRSDAMGFDTPDGAYAGAGIASESVMSWRPGGEFTLDLDWAAGELLLGPVYIPSPETPWKLQLSGHRVGRSGRFAGDAQVTHADTLSAAFQGEFDTAASDGQSMLTSGTADVESLDLAWGWRSGLGAWASSYGWDGLSPVGRLKLQGRWAAGQVESVSATLEDVGLADAKGRLELAGLNSSLTWTDDNAELDLNWLSLSLYRFEAGAAAMQLREDDKGSLLLASPLVIPIIDGAVVVERFEWLDWRGPNADLQVASRVEPIDLAKLTRRLGWSELGGTLSGRIPALHWRDQVLSLQGGLELELFEGRARIDRLELERPLGSLPALSADIEFERLNLAPATRAFEFGEMTGLLSGYMRDLRLLDWRPVRFDAWFETLEDSPSREISQKAVNSLSSVSGGGSAALSGTMLKWFDTFPYARIGIGCRLERNVCTMRGLGPAQPSGYRILEGRLLPRLDIVAHQREVDWPRLVAQLKAATASGPATTSDKLPQGPEQ